VLRSDNPWRDTEIAPYQQREMSVLRLLVIGSLIGVGYTIDVGIGPVLVICTTAFVAWKERNFLAPFLVLTAAFPWFALHHALNYVIGGSFFPANGNPAHFQWPGSPFDASNMTGGWAHPNIGKFVVYALDLLFGKRGFLGHDPALFLALAGAVVLLRARSLGKARVWFALAFMAGSWLVYAAGSNNYSGQCASIRWFVPLLAPGYYLLVLLLRADARYARDLAVLAVGGIVMGALMFWKGPWMPHMVPGYWFILVPALIAWAAVILARMKLKAKPVAGAK
jgi:hypothetical protein